MEKLREGAARLGLSLDAAQIEKFAAYYEELAAWNERINLTAITGYEDVQLKHFLDSLTVVLALDSWRDRPFRAIDVGTGAGLPGLPVKIALPAMRLVLLDSTAKKARFLNHMLDRLALDDVEVVVGRAEDIAHREGYRESFDAVFSRALAPMATLAELTLPFARTGGMVIAQKKGDIAVELDTARHAIELMGGSLAEVKEVALQGLNEERLLVILSKTRPAPPIYPRRSGVPAKRPLQ